MTIKGKLIVIYGINNLGKTTQAKLLVEKLNQKGFKTEYLKYPIYDLEPTGPQIDKILRSGKHQGLSELEFQSLYTQNRKDFEPRLIEKLNQGINILAEDYLGTGIAWGVAKGGSLEEMEKLNEGLLNEDIVIWLDGERFIEAMEKNHIHEENPELMKRCREVHRQLAEKYNWQKINANQTIEKVATDIWTAVEKGLNS